MGNAFFSQEAVHYMLFPSAVWFTVEVWKDPEVQVFLELELEVFKNC